MKTTALKRILCGGLVALAFAALASANPAFAGRWRLDTAHSSALDGWSDMDLVIALDGSKVALTHDMQWRATKFVATNTCDTTRPVDQQHYFRVEQRHMAIYAAKNGVTHAQASWIDGGRTLRLEVETPVEVSQGDVPMRIYSEYRLGELGDTLTLVELHSSRNRPLVYVFHKVKGEKNK
ncbi:MAG: hypothetical protein ACHQ4G_04030 [Opitutales bacterium]